MLKFFIPHRSEGERIVLLLRRHPFVLLTKFLFWVVVAIMPLAFGIIAVEQTSALLSHPILGPLTTLFVSTYYLYTWLFIFSTFVDYYLDVWIVTTDRIINIEQVGLFTRTTSEQKLYRVQDVTSELQGVFSTILNFGTVHIQSAGEAKRFIFKQVPNPSRVARTISQLAENNKKLHHHEMEAEKTSGDNDK